MNPEKIRKVYAPYSTTGEQVGQTPLTGYVDVAQAIYPAVNTGQVSTDGEWSGVRVNDKQFIGLTKADAIANGGDALFPDTNDFPSMNTNGFDDIIFAIRPTNGGNYGLRAVMGPDTTPFANLTPVNAAAIIKIKDLRTAAASLGDAFVDSAEALTADVWNIFNVQQVLGNQRNMQLKVTNNSGGESTIEFAFMRLI
jgi:hypothetical protein